MHMADALLSPAVGGTMYAVSGGFVAWAARKTSADPAYAKKLPFMGVLAAFVFAAQMINFSIPGTGSSGHIGGGLLLAVLLGPAGAILAIASILTIQCLFFADGGLMALGCNIFNLGFWPALIGFPIYQAITRGRRGPEAVTPAAIVAGVLSLELGAFGVVIETLLSGRSELPFAQFCATMLGIHLPIALVEGVITAGVIQFVCRLMPERAEASTRSTAPVAATLLGCALFAGMVVAWFASSRPDGLEWSIGRVTGSEELPAVERGVAARLQKIQKKTAFLPDYGFPAPVAESAREESPPAWPAVSLGASVAGLVGSLVTAAVIFLFGTILYKTRRKKTVRG
jgi:cobalt/nickel transport system permease protein